MNRPTTLAIIPALNEQQALPSVLRDLRACHPGVDMLVVDDGSTDDTALVARAGGAMVAQLPFNLGIGAALRTGFRFAYEQGYDRVFQFDADGQHDGAEVDKLLSALDDGADFVVGSRFAAEDRDYVVGRTRGSAMGVLRLVVRGLVGRRYTDTSSGMRAFNRRAITLFAHRYPKEYMDSVEALVIASYEGLRVTEVAVRMHERAGGEPSNRSFKLAYHYVRVLSMLLFTASRRARKGA